MFSCFSWSFPEILGQQLWLFQNLPKGQRVNPSAWQTQVGSEESSTPSLINSCNDGTTNGTVRMGIFAVAITKIATKKRTKNHGKMRENCAGGWFLWKVANLRWRVWNILDKILPLATWNRWMMNQSSNVKKLQVSCVWKCFPCCWISPKHLLLIFPTAPRTASIGSCSWKC